jgi:hypothetical protein
MTPQERFIAAWPADWQPGNSPGRRLEKSTHLMIGQSRLEVNWRQKDALVTCNVLCNRHGTPYVIPSATSHGGALRCIPEKWAWAALDEVAAGRPLPSVPEWAKDALVKARAQCLEGYTKREAELRDLLIAHDRIAAIEVTP